MGETLAEVMAQSNSFNIPFENMLSFSDGLALLVLHQ